MVFPTGLFIVLNHELQIPTLIGVSSDRNTTLTFNFDSNFNELKVKNAN